MLLMYTIPAYRRIYTYTGIHKRLQASTYTHTHTDTHTQRFIFDRHGLYYTRTTRKETRESQVHAIRTVLQQGGCYSLVLLLSTHTRLYVYTLYIHTRVYKSRSNPHTESLARITQCPLLATRARQASKRPETSVFRDRIFAIRNKLLSGNLENKNGDYNHRITRDATGHDTYCICVRVCVYVCICARRRMHPEKTNARRRRLFALITTILSCFDVSNLDVDECTCIFRDRD